RWRNENYERPVDLEGSGDDDPFGDDELDDVYSGSGSGYFEQESGLETAGGLTTDTSITLPTTAAVLPITSVQPVVTPFEPFPAEDTTPEQTTSVLYIPRMEPGEVTTGLDNELEVPVSSSPSGDFEIREEEEETTRPELGNEVMAVVTPPSGPVLGKNPEPGLMDNTIDSAVIVGGVVGALFAAFLVMLLIYRMKKKDEGSYTLEEPKQANVTYQKPDKQEEFYA
ncbi:Sdc3, partial [Columba guinea]